MITTFQETANTVPFPAHILVMEDEVNVAKGLEMVLSEEGYRVDVANTGHDALERFTLHPFDLLVADLRLPDIDGMEVIRQVKQRYPETGVVVITGYASVASAVDAMKLGTFDYLPKPFTEDEIKSAVDGAVKGKRSVPSETVIEKVEKKEEENLIQKEEVIRVLERTNRDEVFWKDLMENGSAALEGYRLSAAAKAAIVSGDLSWLETHIGSLSQELLAFIRRRLEREKW